MIQVAHTEDNDNGLLVLNPYQVYHAPAEQLEMKRPFLIFGDNYKYRESKEAAVFERKAVEQGKLASSLNPPNPHHCTAI